LNTTRSAVFARKPHLMRDDHHRHTIACKATHHLGDFADEFGSSAEVAQSKNMMPGSTASARAIAPVVAGPPDNWLG